MACLVQAIFFGEMAIFLGSMTLLRMADAKEFAGYREWKFARPTSERSREGMYYCRF